MSELVCKTLELLVENEGSFVPAVKNIFGTRTMATLKISDLSVGDWVRYRDREWEVCSIYQFTEEVGLFRKDSQICESIEDIESIPITAEILEKNGFVKNGEYNEWSTGNWEDIPFIGISLSRPSMRIKNLGTDIFLDNKVVYVHDLQHALRLAGVDKEINL